MAFYSDTRQKGFATVEASNSNTVWINSMIASEIAGMVILMGEIGHVWCASPEYLEAINTVEDIEYETKCVFGIRIFCLNFPSTIAWAMARNSRIAWEWMG